MYRNRRVDAHGTLRLIHVHVYHNYLNLQVTNLQNKGVHTYMNTLALDITIKNANSLLIDRYEHFGSFISNKKNQPRILYSIFQGLIDVTC